MLIQFEILTMSGKLSTDNNSTPEVKKAIIQSMQVHFVTL